MRWSLVILGLVVAVESANAAFEVVSPTPAGTNLTAVWGTGNDVYVVGEVGTILKTSDDGKTWKRLPSGTTVALRGIWGSGPNDVYVVADNNMVLHSVDGGASWKSANPPTHVTTGLYAVWGNSAEDVYVGGVNGALAQTKDRPPRALSAERDRGGGHDAGHRGRSRQRSAVDRRGKDVAGDARANDRHLDCGMD